MKTQAATCQSNTYANILYVLTNDTINTIVTQYTEAE